MRYFILFIFLISQQLSTLSQTCDLSSQEDLLFQRYWEFRKIFDENFIHYDLDEHGNLTSDGIGTWDHTTQTYSSKGKAIPIDEFRYSDYYQSLYNYVGENPKFGHILKLLCLEYRLFQQHGQTREAQTTLNKIFLSLQAIRRLDMTANKLMMTYYANKGYGCTNPRLNTSGYTGFQLRDDTDYNTNKGHQAFGFNVSHSQSIYVTTQITIKDDQENSCPSSPHMADLVNCFPPNETNYKEMGEGWQYTKNGGVVSQDQIIGNVMGLAYVRKLIPTTAFVEYNGTRYYLREINKKIAQGYINITRPNGHKMYYPGCYGDQLGPKIEVGGNISGYYYGLNHTLSWIADQNPTTGTGDYFKWQATISGVLTDAAVGSGPLFHNNTFNARMAMKMILTSNKHGSCKMMKAAYNLGYYHAPFDAKILHNRTYDCSIWAYNGLYAPYPTRIDKQINKELCQALGPMIQSCNPFVFVNDGDDPNLFNMPTNVGNDFAWCTGGPTSNNDFRDQPCKYKWSSIVSPLEFLTFYTMLRYTGELEHDFYDPTRLVASSALGFDFQGLSSVGCVGSADEITFSGPSFLSDFNWISSSNLSFSSAQDNPTTLFTDQDQDSSFIGIQEQTTPDYDCNIDYKITKDFAIGNNTEFYVQNNPLNVNSDLLSSCSRRVKIKSDEVADQDIEILSYSVVSSWGTFYPAHHPPAQIGMPFSIVQPNNNGLKILVKPNLEDYDVRQGYSIAVQVSSNCGAPVTKYVFLVLTECASLPDIALTPGSNYRITTAPNPLKLDAFSQLTIQVHSQDDEQNTDMAGTIQLVSKTGRNVTLGRIENNQAQSKTLQIDANLLKQGENTIIFIPDHNKQAATATKLIGIK